MSNIQKCNRHKEFRQTKTNNLAIQTNHTYFKNLKSIMNTDFLKDIRFLIMHYIK